MSSGSFFLHSPLCQIVYRFTSHLQLEELTLPSATTIVIGRVTWGHYSRPFTPAFWRASLWLQENRAAQFAKARSQQHILRETVFCLLGGYGIRAEVAQAYFKKLAAAGAFAGASLSEHQLRALLSTPALHRGKAFGYRFPNQKARYLAQALEAFSGDGIPREDLTLRDWLLELPGIGRKTAAWIVRNCFGSDNVAIVDVHLQRAGRLMGLFDARDLSAGTYSYFEERFLAFARALRVQASSLDMLIWETMRQFAPRQLGP